MSALTNVFGSSGSSGSISPNSVQSTQIKNKVKEQITQELNVANVNELINKLSENCFDKCIKSPGASLSSSEQNCVNQCTQKYLSAWNLISRTYVSRIQQASAELPR